MTNERPAWSKESVFLQLPQQTNAEHWSPEWAMGQATGAGVRVAIVDSGIEASHPALDGCVDEAGSMDFHVDADGAVVATRGPHDDVFGHGTACAGIIHALAPEATITSVRVLGPGLRGKAAAFHAGLQWAVDEGFDVINLSLGAGKRDWAYPFHEVCDRGYFANSFIVTAANNIQRASFPSLYASVTSVACNTTDDPLRYHFNPEPPTEFLARGIDVEVPWLNGETTVTTGNSFAAPHIAAFAALIRSKHPTMRPFHIKSLLWACAANVRNESEVFEAADPTARTVSPVGRGTIVMRAAPASLPTEAARIVTPANRPPKPPSLPGQIEADLHDIDVVDLLAEGAWGRVYSGSRADGEPVAIRRVDHGLVADASLIARFTASVRSAADLTHPHVLPIQELVQSESQTLIVMPQCPSHLGELDRPAALADVCLAGMSLLAGLNAAHREGIFHGDLRPRNALIDPQGRVVVSDVGLAAPLQSNARTIVSFDPTEWAHRAPELALGGAVGAHTDVYAVGSMLYEMLCGQPPRPRRSGLAELMATAATAVELTPLPPHVPGPIATAIMYALVHEPAYRWARVSDFAASLGAACLDELGPDWYVHSQFVFTAG